MSRNRLSRKLLLCVMGTTSLLLLIISLLNYIWAQHVVVRVSEERASALVNASAVQIRGVLQEKGQYAWILAQNEQIRQFIRTLDPAADSARSTVAPKEITRSLERIAERDPRIVFVYIAAPKTNRLYANKEFDYPPGYDVKSRVWFTESQKQKKMIVTDPYICPLTGHRVVTAAVPVLDETGETEAVVCVDILIDELETIVSGLNVFKTGSSFLLDKSGMPIISSVRNGTGRNLNFSINGTDGSLPESIVKSLRDSTSQGQTLIAVDGEEQYLFHSPIRGLDWTIGFVVPVSEVTYPIFSLGRVSALTVALGLLLVFVLLTSMTSRLISPLQDFSDLMRRVAQGDYSLRAKEGQDDELGDLAISINNMLENQQQLIEHTVKTAYRMGVAGQKLMVSIGEARVTLPLVTANIGHILLQDEEAPSAVPGTLSQDAYNIMHFLDKIVVIREAARLVAETAHRGAGAPEASVRKEEALLSLEDCSGLRENAAGLARQCAELQGDFTNLINEYMELKEKYQETVALLHVVGDNARTIAELQTQSVNQANETAQDLVSWSHVLLEMAVRCNLFPEEGEQGEERAVSGQRTSEKTAEADLGA